MRRLAGTAVGIARLLLAIAVLSSAWVRLRRRFPVMAVTVAGVGTSRMIAAAASATVAYRSARWLRGVTT